MLRDGLRATARSLSLMGILVAVVCAMAGLSASAALATEGGIEFGECIKVPEGTGVWKNGGCTKKAGASTTEQKYNWTPLNKGLKFHSKLLEGTTPVLQGESGIEISATGQFQGRKPTEGLASCKTSPGGEGCGVEGGEWGPLATEDKGVVGEFVGVKLGVAGCKSEGEPEEFVWTKKLHGEPGIITKEAKEEKNLDGVDLRSEEPAEEIEFENEKHEKVKESRTVLAVFQCGPAPIHVTGGVVIKFGEVVSGTFKKTTDKMLYKGHAEFVASGTEKGVQIPSVWEPLGSGISNSGGRKPGTVEHLESKFSLSGKFEKSSQALVAIQENAGKHKLELRQCEKNVC